MKKWLMMLLAVGLLAACSDKEETATKENEDAIGFEMMGEEVEKAKDVPEKEGQAILATFDEYIESFNAKDIDRYTQTLAKDPQGFNLEEDIEAAKNAFAKYDINRTPSDITIVEYNKEQAQVFSNLDIQMTEIETKTELNSSGRQVTVFVNEDGNWKVTSVYYIGNEPHQ